MGKRRWLAASGLVSVVAAVVAGQALAAETDPVRAKADQMAEHIVSQMTLDEKFPQLLNVAPAIPRLHIPAYNWWTESLHGALGAMATTNFPEPIGLAATFDKDVVHEVAGTISVEVRGLHTLARQTGRVGRIGTGLDTWSPNINIFRDPRWGRGQETYGEDPYLTSRMAVAFVTGMQGPNPDLPNVISTPKHFDVHSGPESTRHTANVFVSTHDLEDTYAPAFRAAIVEGHANSIMCAYNRIDGQPACANDLLLKDHLRGAWNFQGYVVSDCDAVKDIANTHHYSPDAATAVAAAMKAGVDNECNNGTVIDAAGLPDRYREALDRGLISTADIDRSLVRLFSARYRNGDLPGLRPLSDTPVADVGTPAHGEVALKAAEESLVLLKNDGVLPLAPHVRVAVVGPFGDATRVLRGNYSSTLSGAPISLIEGLRRAMPGAEITLVPFGEAIYDGDRVPTSALTTPDGAPGVRVSYYNPSTQVPALFDPATMREQIAAIRYQDTPVVTRVEPDVGDRNLELGQVAHHHKTVYEGALTPPETGLYRVGLTGPGGFLEMDGKMVSDRRKSQYNDLPTMQTMELQKGRRYPFRVESTGNVDLVWKRISASPDADMKRAAANADVIVAAVGLTSDLEAEETGFHIPGFSGGDKTTLDIPAEQQAFLEQVKATGKPLVVVAMNGSPINLTWAKANAAAILEAWYPGQAGGLAIGQVLAGQVDPGGRLPLTFYRSVEDLPPFGDYDMKGRTYRYFTGTAVYPFGYGLSYTRFSYAPLTVTPASGGVQNGLKVSTEVRNTGARAGDDVAELYLNFPNTPGAPRVALRGFQRLSLQPGERRAISFTLSPRDLSAVDAGGQREVMVGDYRVSVGSNQPDEGMPVQSARFSNTRAVKLPE